MVYVFDPQSDDWIIRNPAPDDPMPGTHTGIISVRAFRGRSRSDTLWSDLRALHALERLLALVPPAAVRYAFRRVREGGHEGQSSHYAGLAFDIGHKLDTQAQMQYARIALLHCGFDCVEPPFSTPGWLHVEKRVAQPVGLYGGYPRIKQGMRGVHVFVLQDALLQAGSAQGGLTGCFSAATRADLRQFQAAHGIVATGETDAATWRALMAVKSGL